MLTVRVFPIDAVPAGDPGATSETFAFGTVSATVPTDAGSVMLLVPPDTAFVAAIESHEPLLAESNTNNPRNRLLPFNVAVCPCRVSAVNRAVPNTSTTPDCVTPPVLPPEPVIIVRFPVASVVPRTVPLEFVTEIASPLSVIAPVNALAAFDSEMSEPGTDNCVVPVTTCTPQAVISLVPITSSEAEFNVAPLD